MTDAKTLIELAKRCEKATGPDRELDDRIDVAVFPERHAVAHVFAERQGPFCRWLNRCPRYTASLDAALTLVLEGLRFEVTTTGYKPGATVCGNSLTGPHEGSYAATPALALTSASLRARASMMEKNDAAD